MKSIASVLAALLLLAGCMMPGPSGRSADAPPLEAVETLDLARYGGLWYEIARYPNSFQTDCEGVTAEYTLLENGGIGVVNTCRWGREGGEPKVAITEGEVIAGSNGARLFVNFAPIPLPRGKGNYWVLHVDEGYQHALVGEPSGRFLWMLARTPEISETARAELDRAAIGAGYTLALLKETDQTPPEGWTPPGE